MKRKNSKSTSPHPSKRREDDPKVLKKAENIDVSKEKPSFEIEDILYKKYKMRKLKIVVKPINPDLIENFKILEGEKRKISSPESKKDKSLSENTKNIQKNSIKKLKRSLSNQKMKQNNKTNVTSESDKEPFFQDNDSTLITNENKKRSKALKSTKDRKNKKKIIKTRKKQQASNGKPAKKKHIGTTSMTDEDGEDNDVKSINKALMDDILENLGEFSLLQRDGTLVVSLRINTEGFLASELKVHEVLMTIRITGSCKLEDKWLYFFHSLQLPSFVLSSKLACYYKKGEMILEAPLKDEHQHLQLPSHLNNQQQHAINSTISFVSETPPNDYFANISDPIDSFKASNDVKDDYKPSNDVNDEKKTNKHINDNTYINTNTTATTSHTNNVADCTNTNNLGSDNAAMNNRTNENVSTNSNDNYGVRNNITKNINNSNTDNEGKDKGATNCLEPFEEVSCISTNSKPLRVDSSTNGNDHSKPNGCVQDETSDDTNHRLINCTSPVNSKSNSVKLDPVSNLSFGGSMDEASKNTTTSPSTSNSFTLLPDDDSSSRKVSPIKEARQPLVNVARVVEVAGKDYLSLVVDVGKLFKPSEVHIKVKDEKLIVVHCRTESRDEKNKSSFSAVHERRFELDKLIDRTSLRAGCSGEGLLKIFARLTDGVVDNGNVLRNTNGGEDAGRNGVEDGDTERSNISGQRNVPGQEKKLSRGVENGSVCEEGADASENELAGSGARTAYKTEVMQKDDEAGENEVENDAASKRLKEGGKVVGGEGDRADENGGTDEDGVETDEEVVAEKEDVDVSVAGADLKMAPKDSASDDTTPSVEATDVGHGEGSTDEKEKQT